MSANYDELNLMLTEVTPNIDALEIISLTDSDSWSVALDFALEETINLDFLANTERLFLMASLGAPPRARPRIANIRPTNIC